MAAKFAPTKTIAVDVDGTLLREDGSLDVSVLDFVRRAKAHGAHIILWSAAGQAHAREAADLAGADLFDTVIAKPEMIMDDRLWKWTVYCPAVHPAAAAKLNFKPL